MEEKNRKEGTDERCDDCGHVLIENRGEFVCPVCGLVNSTVFDTGPTFDGSKNFQKSIKTFQFEHKLLGSYIDMRRSSPELRNAIKHTYIPSELRNLLALAKRITSLMRLSTLVRERVCFLIHNYPLENVRKSNKETLVAACVHISCEEAQIYRPISDYGIFCNDDYSNFFNVVKEIKSVYNLKTQRFQPEMYIPYICDKIGLDETLIQDAEAFITRAMAYRHNPKSWAAASVILAAVMAGIRIDPKKVAEVSDISITCLKDRIKQIVDYDE